MSTPPEPELEEVSELECVNKSEMVKRGFPFPENTHKYLMQLIFLQIAVVSLTSSILQFLLKPFGLTPTVALFSAGIIWGNSGLGVIQWYSKNFLPSYAIYQLQTMGLFAVMVYLFLVGVKMDLSTIKKSSTKAWVIAISTYITPMIFTCLFSFIMSSSEHYKEDIGSELLTEMPLISIIQSTTSFHAVTCFLTDLKILNTELGRLATSVSRINGLFSWMTIAISFAVVQQKADEGKKVHHGALYFLLSTLVIIVFIAVVLRRYVLWVIKNTPRGETIKDIHVVAIFLMIFGTGYLGEMFGLHCLFGPMLLGLSIPDGEPVGSALMHKLECPITGFLLPIYFLYVGGSTNYRFFQFNPNTPMWILILSLLGSFGKFIGAIIPCLIIYRIPIADAVILGLILVTIGIFDLASYGDAVTRELIGYASFTVMVWYALAIAATTSFLVYWLYNPSRKYTIYKNRTIQNTKQNAELRLLVCIYNDENVPTIINLLEVSNPTKRSQIFIYLLHIIELEGRSTPLLVAHKLHDKLSNKNSPSQHIINCFKICEKQNQGDVTVHPFTTMTPLVSAHDDVCTLAVDNKASLIIIPFHKQWTLEGIIESSKFRNINKKVLNKAPCSVGILIDRRRLNHVSKSVATCWSTYNIGLIFLGDADDREALYYAMRMAEHPNVNLIVHRLVPVNVTLHDLNEKILGDNLINEYRLHNIVKPGHMYQEEVVRDGYDIARAVRALETSYDLIVVGRCQNNYSSILAGLIEWNEYPELGFFGDMFASSDFKGNIPILVMQQHSIMLRNTTSNNEE